MKTRSVLVRRSGALAVAVLTLSFAFGGPNAVRAEDPETSPSILREMVFVPVMRAVQGLEQRLSSLEATIASFAQSITSERIMARQLCVSDDSGAQTCLTKAHLDALLKNQVHAEAQQPSIVVGDASPALQIEEGATDETAAPLADAGEIATTAATLEFAASAASDEISQTEQDPIQTGSIPTPSEGAALVWFPEVEISTPASKLAEE